MPLAVSSVSQLSADLVTSLQAEFSQILQEAYPEIELKRGVIHDVIAHLSGGVCGAITRTEVQRLVDSMSLLAINEDPTLADDTIVDAVLSNYKITRKAGVAASGEIVITVTDPVSVVVPAGAVYTANGVDFAVDNSFVAKPPGSEVLAETEKVLVSAGGNLYYFTVPATAATVGVAGNIRRGTKMVPAIMPDRFVTAYASTDFSGGTDTELNAELLQRMAEGIAAPVMQGRQNILSLIKSQPQFADTLHYSIIGFGNPEMTRDQHGVFPVSGGGRIDIYARTAPLPVVTTLTKTARLVALQGGQGVWQFSILRGEVPGFYDTPQIRRASDPPDAGGFAVVMDQRGFDTSGVTNPTPDIANAGEAAYSAYQTAVIRFVDPETPIAGLTIGQSTGDYLIAVRAMPLITELQTFCRDAGHRNLAADVLVKAAVPCFLSVTIDIEQAPSVLAPDTSAIANAVAAAVNNMSFPGRLNASTIADVVYSYLTAEQLVGSIKMLGRIYRPDGEVTVVQDSQSLRIPELPVSGTTGRTVALILDPVDVSVQVLTQGFVEVG